MRGAGRLPTALGPTFSLELSSKLTMFAPTVVHTHRFVCQQRRVRSKNRANWPFWPPQRPSGGTRKLPGGRKKKKRCTVHDFQFFGQTRLRRTSARSKSRSGDAKTGPGAAQAPPTAPQSAARAPRRALEALFVLLGQFRRPSGTLRGRFRMASAAFKLRKRQPT